MLSKDIRSLFKHSGIYGIGDLAGQAVGFLLLPLYTRYLTPADYGVAAIIEVTMGLVGVTIGAGALQSMARFYHEYNEVKSKYCVVSTMYWIVIVMTSISCVAILSSSSFLAHELFADSRYAELLNIAAVALILGFVLDTGMLCLMIESRSVAYVTISLCNLGLTIGLNIWFIVFMELGLKGIFYSMIIARAIVALVVSFPILIRVGIRFSWKMSTDMLRYSFPLMFSSLFRLGTNESAKYFINYFFSPFETGIYAIAQKIGTAVHMLVTVPFLRSYNPKRFEIMKQVDAPETYAKILNYYLLVIVTAGLTLAVFANEIVRLMATGAFFQASGYIPLVVTSWILFGMRYHFETGMLIRKSTRHFAYINGWTSVLAIALNYLLIWEYKIWGALIALNVSQLVTTGYFYTVSQRLYPVRYRFSFMIKLAALGLTSYAVACLVENEEIIVSLAFKSMIMGLYLLSLRLFGLVDASLLLQIKQTGGKMISSVLPNGSRGVATKSSDDIDCGQMRLKVLYVGDHRDTMNWGGRAQSIALHQLLERHFEISGVIPGRSVLSVEDVDGYVGTLLPQKYIRFLWRIREKTKAADWYLRSIEEPLGARDFITDDPAESADNLVRYRFKNPGLGKIYDQASAADVVVINSEGSGIFRTPFRRDFFFYLALAELAVRLNKRVFFANGIVSDCPTTGRNSTNFSSARMTFSKCDAVLLRDPESLELVQSEMPEVKSEYIPDALFSWLPIYERFGACVPPNGDFIIPPLENTEYLGRLDFSKPYICIGGGSTAADFPERAAERYVSLVQKIRTLGYPVYLTQNCGGDQFLHDVARECDCGIVPWNTPIFMAGAILANAGLFISGRFHPTIFASLGGTPCVFLSAHSHKMASLQQTLEYDGREMFSALPTSDEIDEICNLSARYLREGAPLREKIRSIAGKRCEEASLLPLRVLDYLKQRKGNLA
jgi:O-antigen/teichoic acid export membrane protein